MATRAPRPITFAVVGRVVVCSLEGVPADAVTVEALARLRLAARRRGCRMGLRHASDELLDLIAFMGLDDVLAG